MNITKIINKIITITNVIGAHKGAVIYHQDQVITLANLSPKNSKNISPKKLTLFGCFVMSCAIEFKEVDGRKTIRMGSQRPLIIINKKSI